MINYILLVVIGLAAAGGVYFIYERYEDNEELKKMLTIFVVFFIVSMTAFMIYDSRTRDVAMMTGEQNEALLQTILGWTSGGYSPYLKETWGGTDPQQDFDYDGVKNAWDHDADNDGLEDSLEMPTRYNPYLPDVGIQRMEVKWLSSEEIKVKCQPVETTTSTNAHIILYVNNLKVERKNFYHSVTFNIEINQNLSDLVEVKVDGLESDYANQANNYRSYTIPPSVLGSVGKWYADAELVAQGAIRNHQLYQNTGLLSNLDNMFRSGIAGVPLWLIFLIIIAGSFILLISWWRKKKGKPPLFSWGRKKKEYSPGTTRIQVY